MDDLIEFVPPVPSPCVNICRMLPIGLCAGCGRTPDEIARWSETDDADREAVMAELPARMVKLTRRT